MAVSENRGTPKSKSSILIRIIRFSTILTHPFCGTTIFGNTHILLSPFSSSVPFPFGKSLEAGIDGIPCRWQHTAEISLKGVSIQNSHSFSIDICNLRRDEIHQKRSLPLAPLARRSLLWVWPAGWVFLKQQKTHRPKNNGWEVPHGLEASIDPLPLRLGHQTEISLDQENTQSSTESAHPQNVVRKKFPSLCWAS